MRSRHRQCTYVQTTLLHTPYIWDVQLSLADVLYLIRFQIQQCHANFNKSNFNTNFYVKAYTP